MPSTAVRRRAKFLQVALPNRWRLSEPPLVEQAAQEVADLMYRDEIVKGAAIRDIVVRIVPPEEKPPL